MVMMLVWYRFNKRLPLLVEVAFCWMHLTFLAALAVSYNQGKRSVSSTNVHHHHR